MTAKKEALKAEEALNKLIRDFSFDTVLDVGCGYGLHTARFRAAGKQVTPTDMFSFFDGGVVTGDYLEVQFGQQFDCLWVSHVLEHQLNVNFFLKKLHRDLKEGGLLAISVPPLKHEIVGGHVTLWNAGIVLYNLILAGFDCSQARVKCYGYNISIITPKITAKLPYDQLKFDNGDVDTLAEFFPKHPKLKWQQNVPGNIAQLNWDADEFVMHRDPKAEWRRIRRWFSPRRWFEKPSEKRAA
ncbi:bifunctional 3-demethylubiquinone-9 3-methyltransferase/ 2-octaprenyl-6-hydroxy phenol methylase [Anatilimnocola aggregata]|uniref:Bifunctional 3-demethylubiquinone-9 3-methyltransferase/ 2-octaprenyl-6-hydroxy phenol methylase n=1 Tax=Anatilimnocola aggregata TaxID=2528021 RepID=A0A517YIR8_9BACT|nr:class I SAM-dependent methyltransferase [Anatilimnocola aggregata]QDU30118.1 bifunctional 3-demethylubiquinone-9 3-methyltransferase/ 2-octaprenyl-6-hydroxy phenol methylase [Anatilimnocola aggregata]